MAVSVETCTEGLVPFLFGLLTTLVCSNDAVTPALNWTRAAAEPGVIVSKYLNHRPFGRQLKGLSVCPIHAYKHDPALCEMKTLLHSAGKRMVDEIHSDADVAVYRFFFFSSLVARLFMYRVFESSIIFLSTS